MSTRDRPRDRGRRLARGDLIRVGEEIRLARVSLGRSLRSVAAAAGVSVSQTSRLERGLIPTATSDQLARLGAVVGLDVRLRAYPGPDPIRDAGQIGLLGRLKAELPNGLRFLTEIRVGGTGDQRAWDAVIKDLIDADDQAQDLPVDAETRIVDLQAQIRRVQLKLADSRYAAVLLLVSDTKRNRRALGCAASVLDSTFPVTARSALAALRSGRHPGGSCIVFL